MSKAKKSTVESLFYNNKFLMIFSVVVAVLLWATVKINYSADEVRTFSEIELSNIIEISNTDGFVPFYDEDTPKIKIEVSGKAYNINEHALSIDDIIIDGKHSGISKADYVDLTLTPKLKDGVNSGVTIKKITPSTVRIYFDKLGKRPLEVKTQLEYDADNLVADGIIVGNPVPSQASVEIEGPESLLNTLTEVYFKSVIDSSKLPLTVSESFPAEIVYPLENPDYAKFMKCISIDTETDPITVKLPLYKEVEVETAVEFSKAPEVYSESMPSYTINPSKVTMLYNAEETPAEKFVVGQVDFRELSNTVNSILRTVDYSTNSNIVDKSIEEFVVTVDMSDKSMINLSEIPSKIVIVGNDENYNYNVDFKKSKLDSIAIVGPWDKVSQITEEDVQVDINVSSLNLETTKEQVVEVANISITTDQSKDCWVYGKYNAYITVEPKG